MYVHGAYNDITNLMTLIAQKGDESDETTKSSASGGSSAESSENGGDLVELSELGGLGSLASGLSTDKSVLDSLSERIELLQGHFSSALATKLEEAGIDTAQKISLSRQDDGTVTVVGDCPDKEAIEHILADEPVLTEAFNAIADQSELARKIKSQKNTGYGQGGLLAYLNVSDSGNDASSFFLSMMSGASSSYFE